MSIDRRNVSQTELLKKIGEVWKANSQFTFCQLVSSVNDLGGKDIFDTTDEEFILLLDKIE